MHWEERFRRHAAYQEGLVARFQLPGIGCTLRHWQRGEGETGDGRTCGPTGPRSSLGSPRTDHRRARLAAVLDSSPGSAASRPRRRWLGCGMATFDLAHAPGRPAAGPHRAHRRRLSRSTGSERCGLTIVIVVRGVRQRDRLCGRSGPRPLAMPRPRWSTSAPGGSDDSSTSVDRLGPRHLGRPRRDGRRHPSTGSGGDRAHASAGRGPTTRGPARPSPGRRSRLEELLDRSRRTPLRPQTVVGGHEPIGRRTIVTTSFRWSSRPTA